MPYNQQMRALDQQPNLAKLAEMLQSTRSAGNQYSVPDWVPLVGGSGVGDMFLGKSPEEIENWSYGNAPMQVPEMSRVPQFKKGRAQSLADTAMLLSGPAESTARNAAAGNVGMIIKPKGGNWVNDLGNNAYFRELEMDLPENFPRDWLHKKLASYVKNEMATPEDPIRAIAENWPAKRDKLLAEQVAKKEKLSDLISKYQTEPAPADVVDVDAWRNARTRTAGRDLGDIEKEIGRLEDYNPLHYTSENGFPEMVDEYTRNRRGELNYPEEGLAKTELGKNWETLSDYSIKPSKIKSYLEKAKDNPSDAGLLQANPWMNKLDPESVVYRSIPSVLEYTGLDKLAHGLGRAISDTELPEHLKLDPAKLSRVSIPQAVEHVAKINDWDKYKAYEEAARNPAIVQHKQYPEHGMSLVELKLPPKPKEDYWDIVEDLPEDDQYMINETAHRKARSEGLDPESDDYRLRVDELVPEMVYKKHRENILKDALKYEGEQMNNCVGGYCGDVASGSSRIFSLRDRKGEPHVTFETRPMKEDFYYSKLMDELPQDEQAKLTVDAYDYNAANPHLGYKESVINLMKDRYGPPKELLQQVYGKQNQLVPEKYKPLVRDFIKNYENGLDLSKMPNMNMTDLGYQNVNGQWVAPEDLPQRYANGGLVGTPPTMYDPMKVDDIVASIDAPHNYAEGGSVDKDSLQLDKPQRTPNHPTKSHIVKTMVDGKEKIIRFGEQGAETAGKPKEGESQHMKDKRASFKARHAKNIAKGKSSAAYWADKVKWADGGSVNNCYADGGSVVGDLPFNDPDQLRLYHQAMQHFDDLMENTGGSKKMGKTEARINYNTITKGDRDRDKDLHTLIADYGLDVGKGVNLNATMIKPMEAEGVYLGNLTGSVPVGEGRASLGLQGLHTKYSDGLSGYTAGYNGKVGDGNLSASYFEPADHNSAGRQVQVEYNLPFSKGGSVTSEHERLYRRAMAHYDDLMAA